MFRIEARNRPCDSGWIAFRWNASHPVLAAAGFAGGGGLVSDSDSGM